MKENILAILAGFGFTPLSSIVLFILGAFIGQFLPLSAMPPPQWLLISVILFPLCFGLYLRAYILQKETPHWLDLWRKAQRRRVVGRPRSGQINTVEEHWLQTKRSQSESRTFVGRVFSDTLIWGWATFLSFLALAYICIWIGMMAAS